MKICSHCNTSVSDEYRYCLNCGKALEPSAARAHDPLPTLVYQGPEVAANNAAPTLPTPSSVPPTMPSNFVSTSKSSRPWLPWLIVAACIVTIVVLATIITIQKRSAVTETVAAVQSPEPSPTATSSETASNPNTNQPTPFGSVSPSDKKQTPTLTPTEAASSIVDKKQAGPSITPTPAVVNTPPSTPTPAPPPAVDPNRIYSNRDVTEKLRILSKPKPAYTEDGRKNQVTGLVVLRVVFTSGGTIGNVTVISGLPYGLTEQAIAVAKQIRFVPAQKDGVPVSVSMQVEYVFNLY